MPRIKVRTLLAHEIDKKPSNVKEVTKQTKPRPPPLELWKVKDEEQPSHCSAF